MNPLLRATAATLALVGLSDGSSASNTPQQERTPRHLENQGFSSPIVGRILTDDFAPPWADAFGADITQKPTGSPTNRPTYGLRASRTENPTGSPTNRPTYGLRTNRPAFFRSQRPTSMPTQAATLPAPPVVSPTATPTATPTGKPTATPTQSPTVPPTASPTVPPTAGPTANPTQAPVDNTVSITTTANTETKCAVMPENGNFVTETLDIEYFLYVNNKEGSINDESAQGIVDDSIEPMFHEALADIGLGCETENFVSDRHVLVELSSSGRDVVVSECAMDEATIATNTTDCYTVWGQIKATMWFAPGRRQRKLQATTPFGDREAFNEFTNWLQESLASIDGSNVEGLDASMISASFQGYLNLNSIDGTNTELTTGDFLGVDLTASFQDSGLKADESGIDFIWGLVAIVGGTLVLIFAISVVISRRRKQANAILKHTRVVDELKLDSEDEIDHPEMVNDEDIFQDPNPLPEDLQVKLESESHDYRWIGEERNKSPIFVATERKKGFHDHLETLKRKKEQEILERQYESAMI